MVGNRNKRPFFRDALQILFRYLKPDLYFIQDGIQEIQVALVFVLVVYLV